MDSSSPHSYANCHRSLTHYDKPAMNCLSLVVVLRLGMVATSTLRGGLVHSLSWLMLVLVVGPLHCSRAKYLTTSPLAASFLLIGSAQVPVSPSFTRTSCSSSAAHRSGWGWGKLWFIAFCPCAHRDGQSKRWLRRAASFADGAHVQKTSSSWAWVENISTLIKL